MRSSLTLCCAFLALSLAACTQATAPATDDSALLSLRDADAAVQKAVAARDLDAIAAFYTEDALLLPTAEPLIVGRSAIRDEWAHILAIPNFHNKSSLMKVEVAKSGELGYTMGTYLATMMGEDGKDVPEPGKWVSIWKKQPDGTWRIAIDTYNTDVKPPDHK